MEGNVGTVGAYDLSIKDGKVVGKVNVSKEIAPGISVKGDLDIEIGLRPILELVKKAIPGSIDDAIIDAAEKLAGI